MSSYGMADWGYGTGAMDICQPMMNVPSPGAKLQVCLLSPADYFLTACPTRTHFRAKIDKCTNFAFESILLSFNSNVTWGCETLALIPRIGDMLYWLYVIIDVPAITARQMPSFNRRYRCAQPYPSPSVCNPCNDRKARSCCNLRNDPFCSTPDCCNRNTEECTNLRGPWCNYVDELGFAALPRCAFAINGNVIDCLFNHYLHCWEQLTGKAGKRLEEMIGKRLSREQLCADSQQDRRLYVPLPFYFTEHSGQAFPLISCQFAPTTVHVTFAPLYKLIQVSDCDVEPVLCRNYRPIQDCDMKACLQGTFVFLDMEERDRFALGTFNQLITYVQSYTCVTNTGSILANFNFTNPCIELIWAVQRKCQIESNNTFEYSGAHGRDPLEFCSLSICGLIRFAREGRYFRLCPPYEVHSNIPKAFVYCLSFSTNPEGCEPAGSLDWNRAINAEFRAVLQKEIQCQPNVFFCFSRNYEVLHYSRGLCCKLIG